MTQLRHYDNLGTARFVTFSCYHRRRLLVSPDTKAIFIENLKLVREKRCFRILGYVLMPEHVHLVLHPPDGMPMGLMIRELKSRTAREYFRVFGVGANTPERKMWQLRCYDHNCRSEKSTLEKIEYCHKNPVSRGLVRDSSEWEWSSYNWYQGRKNVPIEMDNFVAQ